MLVYDRCSESSFLFSEGVNMRFFLLILAIGFMLKFAASAEEKEAPAVEAFQIEIKKDDANFSEHFESIVGQVTCKDIVPKAVLTKPPESLKDAWNFLKKDRQFKRVWCFAEWNGWYLFSTMGGIDKTAPNMNLSLVFHDGFALKKGTDKVYYFGFW